MSAAHAIEAEVRLYDRLFTVPNPDASGDFKQALNPNSLEVITARVEPSLRAAQPGVRYQFERLGYFCVDVDNAGGAVADRLVFNRTITLKDTWARETPKV